MSGDDKPQPRLVPARPARDEEYAAYMPRLPVRLILLGALSVCTVSFGFWLSQQRKADALRAQILEVGDRELAEPARRYLALRKKLEDLILGAARGAPDAYADKRLRLSGLRAGRGLYLRLSAADATSRARIERGADSMEGDAIASCLGLAPVSARGLWEKGAFLAPGWLAETRKTDSVMKLRVTDTMLANHIKNDLPVVLNMMRSDWFLLVLQQGDDRREHPVDAFLWDLRSGQQLLRGRIQAAGVLFSVHVSVKDAPRGPRPPAEPTEVATANDCSIAAQIRALAGAPLASVENQQQAAVLVAGAASPAAPAAAPAAPAAPTPPAPAAPAAATPPGPAAAAPPAP